MTTYGKALVVVGLSVVTIASAIGGVPLIGRRAAAILAVVVAVTSTLSATLLRCPACGTSPFLFGPAHIFGKPIPSRRCSKCRFDLASD